MSFQQGNNMRGNAAMPVFLSDAIANGRLGQTLLYIKDFRKANQFFRIILKIDSCDKLFLFFKISPGKVANCRQCCRTRYLSKLDNLFVKSFRST